ncbi:hypothetical protein ACFWAX_19285, partial [Streptomyces sp. NPDC059956]
YPSVTFVLNAPSGSRIEIKNDQGKKYTTSGSGKFFSVMVNDKDVTAWACGFWPRSDGENAECSGGY